MNITTYFLKHPVIALTLNAMILIIGVLCFNALSLREYPEVHFSNVMIITSYPNASAELVETAVTNVLEDQLAGIEGIESITSDSKYGRSEISILFNANVSMDRALISVREAIGLAQRQLPKEVKDPVVERQTASEGMPFIVISIASDTMDFGALTHYANLNLKNGFRSIKGVSSTQVWGQPYTYEIRLNPQKMYLFGVNADEIFDALQKNNLSLPVGKFQNEIPVTLNAELKNLSDYEQLVVKEKKISNSKQKQQPILLKQVADIELKTDDKKFRVHINRKPGLGIAIHPATDANPLEVSKLVHQQVEALQKNLPSGLHIDIIWDQADFIRASLNNIKSSLFEAIIFVLVIVFLFLRNIKATLVPLVTIPISLLGSFIFLKVFGFSINIMTLMAMVLAVGLVVDDAIVVLENIHRHIENGLSRYEAALKGSKEIGFAIIAMTLTLASVYAPLAFISGTVGQLFAEFAVALSGSVFISGIVALTLSPLMCAKTLSKNEKPLWPKIDDLLQRITDRYHQILTKFIQQKKICVLTILSTFTCILILIQIIPSEMAPKEDRSRMGIFIPSIAGKDINTIETKAKIIEERLKDIPEVENTLTFMGNWGANIVLNLSSPSQRSRTTAEIKDAIRPLVTTLPSADVHIWSWDSGLPGVDDSLTGSELTLVVSTVDPYRKLFEEIEKTTQNINEAKLFPSLRHNLKLDTPGYDIELDMHQMANLNLTANQIAKVIEIFFSGDQSLSFSKDGILYAVTLQGYPTPWTLGELYVTNPLEKRISLSAVAQMVATTQPEKLYHFNQMRSVTLTADTDKDEKIEKSMTKLLNAANETLPAHYKKTWTGAAKAYTESHHTMVILFILALVFIFAILAVQFENFVDPFIILLTVPLACSGALAFVWIFDQSLNIYTQVGLITLVGLITKHGILIVEFANQLQKEGRPLLEAIVKASTLRLRPVLMTTGAMVFGAIPLVLSQDSGYEARHIIGIVLIGGLSVGTIFTLFFLPTVYWMVKGRLLNE